MDGLQGLLHLRFHFAVFDERRRSCTMIGTCSTATGQISTHAMQVRHDHTVLHEHLADALAMHVELDLVGQRVLFERLVREFLCDDRITSRGGAGRLPHSPDTLRGGVRTSCRRRDSADVST